MDLIQSEYQGFMRPYLDRPDVLVPGRWIFCEPGAKIVPYFHPYGSSSWDEDTHDYLDLGDVRQASWRTMSHQPIPGMVGERFCGDEFHWTVGSYFAEAGLLEYDSLGRAVCCGATPLLLGGDGDGGSAVQERQIWQDASGGDSDDGMSLQDNVLVQLAAGGDSDDGTSLQVAGDGQASSGGDSDDGTAPQGQGEGQLASGGDADDGTATQAASSGGIQTTCCPGPIANVLQANIATVDCPQFDGSAVTISWNAANDRWEGQQIYATHTLFVTFQCSNLGLWTLGVSCTGYQDPINVATGVVCSPLSVQFTTFFPPDCGCGPFANWTVTVTE